MCFVAVSFYWSFICSLQELRHREMLKRYTLISESSGSYILWKRIIFSNLLIPLRKPLDTIWSIQGMGQKLKLMLLLRNGVVTCNPSFDFIHLMLYQAVNWKVEAVDLLAIQLKLDECFHISFLLKQKMILLVDQWCVSFTMPIVI